MVGRADGAGTGCSPLGAQPRDVRDARPVPRGPGQSFVEFRILEWLPARGGHDQQDEVLLALFLEAVGHPTRQVEDIARLHLAGLLALLPHTEDATAARHIDDVVLLIVVVQLDLAHLYDLELAIARLT